MGRVQQRRSYGRGGVVEQAGAHGVRQRRDLGPRVVHVGSVRESGPHLGGGIVREPGPLGGLGPGARREVDPCARGRVGQDHRDGRLGQSGPLEGVTGRTMTDVVDGEQAEQQRCRQRRIAGDSVQSG